MKGGLILFLCLFFFSCGKIHEIHIQGDINLEGIEAWDIDYTVTSKKATADLKIVIVDSVRTGNNDAGCHVNVPIFRDVIEIKKEYADSVSIIAHEIGHYLGHKHSQDNNSIMNITTPTSKPIWAFNEFTHLEPTLEDWAMMQTNK